MAHLNSTSSNLSQRDIRIEKMHILKLMGLDPFTPYSHRDFDLGCIKFWFKFIHDFDLNKLNLDVHDSEDVGMLDYFLDQVLFPQGLVEKMEERLHIRNTVRQMGLDPDDEQDYQQEFEPEVLSQAVSLLPDLKKYSKERRRELKNQLIIEAELDDSDSDYVSTDSEEFDMVTSNQELVVTLKPNQMITLAGRIKTKRISGKIAFGIMEDESCPEGFQFVFKRDLLDNQDPTTELEKLTNTLAKTNLSSLLV